MAMAPRLVLLTVGLLPALALGQAYQMPKGPTLPPVQPAQPAGQQAAQPSGPPPFPTGPSLGLPPGPSSSAAQIPAFPSSGPVFEMVNTGPKPPLPALPPGFGMGGFQPPPDVIANGACAPDWLSPFLSVRLRDQGTLRLYGMLRGDYDTATARFNDIQNPFFVLPDDPRFLVGPARVPLTNNGVNYSLYPRLSRAGLEYYGNPIDSFFGALPSGRLEIDFLTPGFAQTPESRELLRLRLAYAAVQIGEFSLVVGQDWDIVSPLIPTIDENTYLWNAGNLGDRRPQIKFLWDHDLGNGTFLQVHNGLALADAINSVDLDGNGLRDHEAFGFPGYEGRVGLVMPSAVAEQPIMAGVWGMLAVDETGLPLGLAQRRFFRSRGIGVDLRVPILDWLTFQGEAWTGRNLDEFRGGIAQGVNVLTGETIEASGGWMELVCRPAKWYQLSVGCSIDKPVAEDVAPGGRTKNFVWYVGNRFPVGNGLLLGLDYEHWTTDYRGLNKGEASLVKFFVQQSF